MAMTTAKGTIGPATYCNSNNKSPVELPENSIYRLIGMFEIRTLTPKREKNSRLGGKKRIFVIFRRAKVPNSELI